jgi:hypothetical protein
VTARRRAGIASLLVGVALVLGARLVPGLGGPPLYDGVVTVGPYLWLNPGPGQQGDPQGARATVRVIGGENDIVALATPESLPQAQILAVPGSLILPSGARSLSVAITPVPPPGQPSDGVLGGNVYRFDLTDQTGAVLTARASDKVSIVLRSADKMLMDGVVERWDGSRWVPLPTQPPGVNGAYLAVVTQFGDYAVVVPGAASPGPSGGSASGPGPSSAGGSAAPGASGGASPAGRASPSETPVPAVASTGGPGVIVPIVAATVIALLALAVILLLGGRSGPRGPAGGPRSGRSAPSAPYRGAHRVHRASDSTPPHDQGLLCVRVGDDARVLAPGRATKLPGG